MKKITYFILVILLILPTLAFAQTDWVNVAGFEPGSSVIPERGKEALKDLVSEYDPNQKSIRIIGMADTLGHKGKSPLEGEIADTTLALERAEAVAYFYNQLGYETEVIAIQNFIPRYRGHRGVQIQLTEKAQALKAGDLILIITAKSNESEKTKKVIVTGEELLESWQEGNSAYKEITIDISSDEKKDAQTSNTLQWSLDIGFKAWVTGSSWNLVTPTASLGFYKKDWAINVGGGYAPWEQSGSIDNTKDALIFGEITGWPENKLRLKTGLLVGWKVLANSDHWSEKVESPFIGPSYTWRELDLSILYAPARTSSLTKEPFWQHGVITEITIKIY